MTLKCVGKNPRLASAKSKNDKNITGLINSVESGRTIIYNFVNVAPFEIGQPLTNVMDIDFTATEDTTAAFQCEMLLEVIKPEDATADGETEEENPEPELPELSIIYKINNETIDTFMPTKTCLYGKHIMTLFFPISKVIENSSNTFSMYLKYHQGAQRSVRHRSGQPSVVRDSQQDWETGMDASISMRILEISALRSTICG